MTLEKDFSEYVPRALEILTLYKLGDHESGREVIAEYSHEEAKTLLSCMAAIAAAMLEVAYSCTELEPETWMPHFSAGLTGMFMDE